MTSATKRWRARAHRAEKQLVVSESEIGLLKHACNQITVQLTSTENRHKQYVKTVMEQIASTKKQAAQVLARLEIMYCLCDAKDAPPCRIHDFTDTLRKIMEQNV